MLPICEIKMINIGQIDGVCVCMKKMEKVLSAMLLMLALGAFIDSSQAADNITCYEACAAECDKKSDPKCSNEVCLIWQYKDHSMFLIRDLGILMITRADLDRLSRLLELGRSESNFRGIFMQFLLPRKVTHGYEQGRIYFVVTCPNISSVHTCNQFALVPYHFLNFQNFQILEDGQPDRLDLPLANYNIQMITQMGSAMFKVSQYSQLWGEGAESLKGSQTREVTKHGEIV